MRKTTSRLLLVCLILLFLTVLVNTPLLGQAASAMTGAMHKAPYLIYPGNNTQMKVLWQLYSTASCTIDWGTDTLYSVGSTQTSEYGASHQHSYTITNLVPSTKYYYRVSVSAETYVGSFRAAPPSDTSSTKLIVYGDSRTYPADHDSVANGIVSTYAADSSFQSLVISVGDLATNGDMESYWDSELFATGYPNLQTMLGTMPFQSVRGNHEGAAALFSKYLPYPFVAGAYWSFDYGPAHFVIVDQYVNYGPGSAQLAWIENDLDTTTKPWKFICLHAPGWSAGTTNNTSVQNYIQPLCEEYGVRVLFAGHNHYYARAVVNGVQHITTAGGGAPLYTPNLSFPYIVTATKCHHYCKVEIDGNVFHLTAFTPTGQMVDSFTVVGPPLDITPPQVALVRPNGGEVFYAGHRDTIRWVATDDVGVRYVNIYYSTDGGATFPYTVATKEPNDSVYVWQIPVTLSDSCIVKIVAYDTSHNDGQDVSDTFVSLVGDIPPQVTVIRPNGAEVFYANSQDTIKWVATDDFGVDSVHIYYSIDGGSTYPYSIAAEFPNTGLYLWMVPATPSNTCKVKVVAYDAVLNETSDTSDNNSAITFDLIPPQVTVVRPNGGEIFYVGSEDTIRWVATDDVGVDSVHIYYSTNGGSTYPYSIAANEPNDGVYVWSLPYKNSSTCRVKVVAYDRGKNEVSDTSDNNFTITYDMIPPQVSVVRPNGGEILYVGSEDTIRWIATDNVRVDSVSIYYSIDSGTTFPYTVATGQPNDSVYVWTVPDVPSDSCVVKIEAYDFMENVGEDVSNALFSIRGATGVEPVGEVASFGLPGNYPNPFNPMTRIEFILDERAQVCLGIYDILGRLVKTLVQEPMSAGRHSVMWNGEDETGRTVASGVYVCRLDVHGKTAMRKMVLLR